MDPEQPVKIVHENFKPGEYRIVDCIDLPGDAIQENFNRDYLRMSNKEAFIIRIRNAQIVHVKDNTILYKDGGYKMNIAIEEEQAVALQNFINVHLKSLEGLVHKAHDLDEHLIDSLSRWNNVIQDVQQPELYTYSTKVTEEETELYNRQGTRLSFKDYFGDVKRLCGKTIDLNFSFNGFWLMTGNLTIMQRVKQIKFLDDLD